MPTVMDQKWLMVDKAVGESTDVMRELTYGEKQVGLTFNPGWDTKVKRIKELYASIIDIIYDDRCWKEMTSMKADHYSDAVTDAVKAQMMAVKAITFKY